jgi:hypothetical protein
VSEKNSEIPYGEIFKLMIISLSASMFSGLLITFVDGFATIYTAYDFDIPAYFNLSGIYFTVEKSSSLWYLDSQVAVLLTKPVVSLFIGLFALASLIVIKKKLISFFFFLFWLNLYAFNNSVGILVDDIIARTGIYEVSILFKLNTEIFIVAGIVATYFLYKIGIVNTLAFRSSIFSRFITDRKMKTVTLFFLFFVPWISNFILLIIDPKVELKMLTVLENFSMLIMILPFFIYNSKKKIQSHVKVYSEVLVADWINTILFIVGILFLYFTMRGGISISDIFNVSQ